MRQLRLQRFISPFAFQTTRIEPNGPGPGSPHLANARAALSALNGPSASGLAIPYPHGDPICPQALLQACASLPGNQTLPPSRNRQDRGASDFVGRYGCSKPRCAADRGAAQTPSESRHGASMSKPGTGGVHRSTSTADRESRRASQRRGIRRVSCHTPIPPVAIAKQARIQGPAAAGLVVEWTLRAHPHTQYFLTP